MKKFRKNKKGFTLVEVVVVLVIIAILIAIAVPSVMKYIDDANEAKYLAEARAVYIAAEAELTKDYADDKTLNQSTGNFITNVSDASGITVKTITYGTVTTPNEIKTYVVKFTSPSSKGDVTVSIDKNGTAKLVK